MAKFQTFITKAKDAARSTATRVRRAPKQAGAKVAETTAPVRTTIKTRVTQVRTVAAEHGVSAVFKMSVKALSRAFGWAVAIEVVLRFISNPRSITKLWTDWRNNPRRAVSVLWSAAMLVLAGYILTITWAFTKVIVAAVLFVFFVCLVWDFISQVVRKEGYNEERMARHFKPARVALRWAFYVLLGIAIQLSAWVPKPIADYIAPAYAATVVSEPVGDEEPKTEVFNSEKVNDIPEDERVFTSASVKVDGEPVDVEVDIDGTEFHRAPYKAGASLASRLMADHGPEAARLYHARLQHDLQMAKLPKTDVLNAVKGYESVMPTVDA